MDTLANRLFPLPILVKYVFTCWALFFCSQLVLAQGPGRSDFERGENLRKSNNCKEAITSYNKAINKEPSNYKYYFMTAKCQIQLKYYDEAKNSLDATIEYKPSFTSAYSLLAKIYKEEGDFDQAIYNY